MRPFATEGKWQRLDKAWQLESETENNGRLGVLFIKGDQRSRRKGPQQHASSYHSKNEKETVGGGGTSKILSDESSVTASAAADPHRKCDERAS